MCSIHSNVQMFCIIYSVYSTVYTTILYIYALYNILYTLTYDMHIKFSHNKTFMNLKFMINLSVT